MAKQIVYFNATKQIETITIHYNDKLDGTFVDDVAQSVKDIAKKMKGVDLKSPKAYDAIKVFVYPSKDLFYKVFAGEIEKRFYARRRSLEDLYVVQDSEGNIHIVSPRGMVKEKRDAFKKILVMKILGQYMDEKQKQSAETLLKQAMQPKEEEIEEQEPEVSGDEQEIEELEQDDDEIEQLEEEEIEEAEKDDEELEQDSEEQLDDEQVEEIIETELVMEQIDEKQELEQHVSQQQGKNDEKTAKEVKRSDAQEWLSVGWLAYIRGKLKKEEDIKRFANNISKKGVKKLGQLTQSKWYGEYNYSEEFACAWVECIISTYGMKKFLEYYENPKDIKRIFGVPKFVFESQVKAYIKEKYKGDEKLLKVTDDIKIEQIVDEGKTDKEKELPVSEITALHFSQGGGVDIISDKEIVEPVQKEII